MNSPNISSIRRLEQDHVAIVDRLLTEQAVAAFVLWGNAFPKRYLKFVSGMGTSTFDCPSMDGSMHLLDFDSTIERSTTRWNWNDRVFEMLKPFVEFHELFWCGEMYKYPAIADITYNPITKTVEWADQVVQL
jgi:hypothetical protein